MDLKRTHLGLKLFFLIFLTAFTNGFKLDEQINVNIDNDDITKIVNNETPTISVTTSTTTTTTTTTAIDATTTTTELVDIELGDENVGNREVVLIIVCVVTGSFLALGAFLLWKNFKKSKKSKKNKAAKEAAQEFQRRQEENTKFNRQLTIDNEQNLNTDNNNNNNNNNNTGTFNNYANNPNTQNTTGNKQTLFTKNNSSSRNLNTHVGFKEHSVDEVPPRRGSRYPVNKTFVNDENDSIKSDRDDDLNKIQINYENRASGKPAREDYARKDASKNFDNNFPDDDLDESFVETKL